MAPTDPESTALRAALTADPTDVTLRLVYADRLDEAGDPALAALWRWLGETRRFPRRADQRDRVVRTLGPGPLAASIVERMDHGEDCSIGERLPCNCGVADLRALTREVV
jgi:uncharacterized protein (TIGR02996 family)